MFPSINPEYSPSFKLEILLAHQGEFLSTFLHGQFTRENDRSIAQGEFNPRDGFSIEKSKIKQYIKEREVLSSRPNLLSEIFYFEKKKSRVVNFERSAKDDQSGYNSTFYVLLEDLFRPLLRKELTRSDLECSLLAPILSISKTLGSKDSLIFDRDKVNNFFGRLYQKNYNSPKEELEKLAHDYLIRAENPLSIKENENSLLKFTNKFLTGKQLGTFDSIEKLCQTSNCIYGADFALNVSYISDDFARFKIYINNLLNELDLFRKIYTDFSPLYAQTESFFNIIESRLDAYKDPESKSTSMDTLDFYRKATREIRNLLKIFKNQGRLTDGRASDENRLTIVSYQAGRVCDFLTQINRGIADVDGAQECYNDIRYFISDVKEQIERNRVFYSIIIDKNAKLIELVDSEKNKIESKIDAEKFFEKVSHLTNSKTSKVEGLQLDKILSDYGLTVINASEGRVSDTRKSDPVAVNDILSLSFSDIAHEISILKSSGVSSSVSDSDFEELKRKSMELEIDYREKEEKARGIEDEITNVVDDIFNTFEYSKAQYFYKASNTDNNHDMGLLFAEPYLELRKSEVFRRVIFKSLKEYSELRSYLKGVGSDIQINSLFDFAKDHLELNVIKNLQNPLIKENYDE